MVATTGVSSVTPAVTSIRPLSVRPVLMASRVMRLSVMVSTKLPSPSEPTAAAGTVSASGCRLRDLGIHSRVKPFLRVGQIDLGTHVARLGVEPQGEAGYTADERLTVEARGLDDGWIADVKVRHVVLGDVTKHTDRIDPLNREKRRRPRARGGLD